MSAANTWTQIQIANRQCFTIFVSKEGKKRQAKTSEAKRKKTQHNTTLHNHKQQRSKYQYMIITHFSQSLKRLIDHNAAFCFDYFHSTQQKPLTIEAIADNHNSVSTLLMSNCVHFDYSINANVWPQITKISHGFTAIILFFFFKCELCETFFAHTHMGNRQQQHQKQFESKKPTETESKRVQNKWPKRF